MQSLKSLPVPNADRIAIAQIEGDFTAPNVRRYIFSTQETADIVNKPEVLGVQYTEALEEGITQFLKGFKDHLPFAMDDRHANVLHFLRGGLNFGIREALAKAYNWNTHDSTYMSSQRDRDEEGRWFIKEDSYRKSTMKKGSVIFCGDVVATGVTLDKGLETLTKIMQEDGASIRYVMFFTFGCHKAEKVLEEHAQKWQSIFPDFEGIDIVYIEGKFHLADSKTPTTIKLQGTDLLRRDSLLMPEFIERQEQNIIYALERCTIYDAGARAFDIEEYAADVAEYWEQVLALAKQGVTTSQYLEERFPEASPNLQQQAAAQDLASVCQSRLEHFQALA